MLIPNTYNNNSNNIRYNSINNNSRCSNSNDRIYMKSIILCKVTIVWLIVCESAILYSINNYIHAFNYNNSINNNNSDSDGVVLLGWVLPVVLVLCAYYIINMYKHHAITYSYSYYNNNNSNNNNRSNRSNSNNYSNYTNRNNSSNSGVGYS